MFKNKHLQVWLSNHPYFSYNDLSGADVPECEPNDCGVLCDYSPIVVVDAKDKYFCFELSKQKGSYYLGYRYEYDNGNGGGGSAPSPKHDTGYPSPSEAFREELKDLLTKGFFNRYYQDEFIRIIKELKTPVQLTLDLF